MNIFVSGGLGYVGTELITRLLSDGHKVTTLDSGWFGTYLSEHSNLSILIGDIREIPYSLKDFDIVIHLANIANDPGVELNPTLSWEVNVLATHQLMQKSLASGVRAFHLCEFWKCLWCKRA